MGSTTDWSMLGRGRRSNWKTLESTHRQINRKEIKYREEDPNLKKIREKVEEDLRTLGDWVGWREIENKSERLS